MVGIYPWALTGSISAGTGRALQPPHLQSILYCTVEYSTMYCSVLTILEGAGGPSQVVVEGHQPSAGARKEGP